MFSFLDARKAHNRLRWISETWKMAGTSGNSFSGSYRVHSHSPSASPGASADPGALTPDPERGERDLCDPPPTPIPDPYTAAQPTTRRVGPAQWTLRTRVSQWTLHALRRCTSQMFGGASVLEKRCNAQRTYCDTSYTASHEQNE